MPCLAAGGEEHAEQLIYFARDFLLDGFRRFFSWAEKAGSAIGRNWQIFSLISNSCSPSSRKSWHSATSRCALAKLAGVENVVVTVLPCTLRVNL